MTDKEFIEMTRLLDSLIKGADTLRDLFPGKVTDDVRSNPQFKARWALLTRAEKEVEDLVGLINGCEDWTSDKFQASEIYRMMRGFVSATSRMPVGISYPFKKVRSLCEKPMAIIPGKYPDLYPPKVRELMDSPYYKDKIGKEITPPFTWNGTLIGLATFINIAVDLRGPKIYQVDGKNPRRDWTPFDGVFRIDGTPVTSKQLRDAWKH